MARARVAAGDAALVRFVRDLRWTGPKVNAATGEIYHAMLEQSRVIDAGNFTRIGASDLRRMFRMYDERFFEGHLAEGLREQAVRPLGFRFSRRMTSAGGTTTRVSRRRVSAGVERYEHEFDIAISSTLLYQTFRDEERSIRVSGVLCRDRLEALQRVFEHEILHLAEMLAWGDSNCSAARFRALARRIFSHQDVRHELITPRERAYQKLNLRVGDRVSFEHEGRTLKGFLNRITRRATVLVESPEGTRYNDGKRYLKYYIPLEMLRPRGK